MVLSLLTGKNLGKRPGSRSKQRVLRTLTRGMNGQLERDSSGQNRIDIRVGGKQGLFSLIWSGVSCHGLHHLGSIWFDLAS